MADCGDGFFENRCGQFVKDGGTTPTAFYGSIKRRISGFLPWSAICN
jgi:hypothetical protein